MADQGAQAVGKRMNWNKAKGSLLVPLCMVAVAWMGEPRVLDLERTHASQVRHAGTCVLALPAIPSRRADAVLAAHLRDRQPGLAFL